MKKIIVIAQYEAYIPEDMDASQIQELAEKTIRDKCEDFRITVDSYLEVDEQESEPLFELKDVMAGETVMIAVG